MSAPKVDVLAVMLALLVELDDEQEALMTQGQEARAAVAEFVEAARPVVQGYALDSHGLARLRAAFARMGAWR